MSLNYQEILRNADKLRIFLPFFLKNTRLHCFNLYNFGWWKLKNTNKLVPYSQGPGQCQEQAQFFQFRVHLPIGGHVLPFSSAWSYQQLNLRLLELALAPQTQTPHPVPCHHPGPEKKTAIINCQLPNEAGITKKRKEKKRGFFFKKKFPLFTLSPSPLICVCEATLCFLVVDCTSSIFIVVDTLYSKTLNLQLNRAQGARRRKRGKTKQQIEIFLQLLLLSFPKLDKRTNPNPRWSWPAVENKDFKAEMEELKLKKKNGEGLQIWEYLGIEETRRGKKSGRLRPSNC
jgi:hypothetical protein